MHSLEIAYVNVYVSDVERAAGFYEKSLGLTLNFCDNKFGYASLTAGPIRLGLAQIAPEDEKNRALIGKPTGIGFATPELDTTYAELASRGVVFTMKPEKQPWGGYMASFADPDGNTFYLDQIAHA